MHWMYFHGFHLFYPSRPILFRQSHWTTHHSRFASRSNCNPIQFNFRTLKRDIVLADNYVRLAWSIAIEIWWSIPLKGVDKLSPWSYWNAKQSDDRLMKAKPTLLYLQQLYQHPFPISCTLVSWIWGSTRCCEGDARCLSRQVDGL